MLYCNSGLKIKIKNGVNIINMLVIIYSRYLCSLSLLESRLNSGWNNSENREIVVKIILVLFLLIWLMLCS